MVANSILVAARVALAGIFLVAAVTKLLDMPGFRAALPRVWSHRRLSGDCRRLDSDSGAAEWRPKRVSSAHGMLSLLANSAPAQDRPEETLRTLGRALSGAVVFEGERGEAAPAAIALLDLLAVHRG
jgi:hypothetical protein